MYYARIIEDKTAERANKNGQFMANTKMPNGRYHGMGKDEFTEATKYITHYKTKVVEFK